jgi:uncharacterized protein YhjY with autotransporter beta-barrel domain
MSRDYVFCCVSLNVGYRNCVARQPSDNKPETGAKSMTTAQIQNWTTKTWVTITVPANLTAIERILYVSEATAKLNEEQ